MSIVDRFDIDKVKQTFERCLHEKDDILLDEYLMAYEEINKFFSLLGTVFAFISSDVRSKIDILYKLRREGIANVSSNGQNFHTIKTMMSFEKENDLFRNTKYVSGSRTLLRLHRGLEFLYEFLNGLGNLGDNNRTYTCCKNAYESTLAVHHPWMVRKGALVAMYALPTRGELLKRVCIDVTAAIEALPGMLNNTKIVYDRTHALYTLYDLHNLP